MGKLLIGQETHSSRSDRWAFPLRHILGCRSRYVEVLCRGRPRQHDIDLVEEERLAEWLVLATFAVESLDAHLDRSARTSPTRLARLVAAVVNLGKPLGAVVLFRLVRGEVDHPGRDGLT